MFARQAFRAVIVLSAIKLGVNTNLSPFAGNNRVSFDAHPPWSKPLSKMTIRPHATDEDTVEPPSPPTDDDSSTSTEDSSTTKNAIPIGKFIFAFGPQNKYFFYSHAGDSWQTSISGAHGGHADDNTFAQLKHPSMFAFSPYGDEFAAYPNSKTDANTWSFVTSNAAGAPSYQSLRDWLAANIALDSEDAMKSLKVVFGPGASYYACFDGKHIYHDLPPNLAKTIQDKYSESGATPTIIALGGSASKGATYFARWPEVDGFAHTIWSLNTETSLYKLLDSDHEDEIADVFLSPVSNSDFVAVHKDGSLTWNQPGSMGGAWFPAYFYAHMQGNAKAMGKTYSYSTTRSGTKVEQHVLITPDTNYGFDDATDGPAKFLKADLTVSGIVVDWFGSWFR